MVICWHIVYNRGGLTMFQQGIQYERFCESGPELELRRHNDWLSVTLILATIFLPVALVYQLP